MNLHGQDAVIENYDLRKFGIWECPLVEVISSWGSMHTNKLHSHAGSLELCFLAAGRRVYVDARRTCVMNGGNVWRNAPDVPHSSVGRPSGSSRFYCMALAKPVRGKTWCGLGYEQAKVAWGALMTLDPSGQPLAFPWMRQAYDHFFELLRSDKKSLRVGPLLRMAFNALVTCFVRSAVCPSAPVEGTEQIRTMIDTINRSDPHDALQVKALVNEAGITASYFVGAFKKVTGQTPGQYILSRRLESAARHIAAGESVKRVAYDYRFDSSQHFARAFRKYFLETPSQYFQRVKAAQKSNAKDLALR